MISFHFTSITFIHGFITLIPFINLFEQIFNGDDNHHEALSSFLTLICLFIVIMKSTIKYITKMGQNTGMLKNSKNVQTVATTTALVAPYLQRQKVDNVHFTIISIPYTSWKLMHMSDLTIQE
mgnify:FL=1